MNDILEEIIKKLNYQGIFRVGLGTIEYENTRIRCWDLQEN